MKDTMGVPGDGRPSDQPDRGVPRATRKDRRCWLGQPGGTSARSHGRDVSPRRPRHRAQYPLARVEALQGLLLEILAHHFVDARFNHGVTSPLWDVVFGTYRAPGVIPVPVKLKMQWLTDPQTGEVHAPFSAWYTLRGRAS